MDAPDAARDVFRAGVESHRARVIDMAGDSVLAVVIHLGDVIGKSDGTVYGDGVSIAARLEGLAAH